MPYKVFVLTNDRHLWAVQVFAYLFNKHWSTLQDVVVAGYALPTFELPPNFSFYSIDSENYPAERWSDGVIRFLQSRDEEMFVMFLEDMWLCRTVNVGAIPTLMEYMGLEPNIARIDLTDDRLYAGNMKDWGYWGHYDLVWSDPESPYHISLQAGIWRREKLLEVLVPGETPWELELIGSARLRDTGSWVLGTRQRPVRYCLALKSEHPTEPALDGLTAEDISELRKKRWISN